MIVLFKSTILNNLTIKIFSLIIGYCLWSFLSGLYMQTSTVQVPICFYNIPTNKEVTAQPETIAVQIRGKKADLKRCTDLALHVDAESLTPGQHKITPSEEQLFLPKTVTMVHYKPLAISLTVTLRDAAHATPQGDRG